MKKNIFNFTIEQLYDEIKDIVDHKYRTSQIFSSLHKNFREDFSKITGIPIEFRENLARNFFFPYFKLLTVSESKDNTQKFLFEIADIKSKKFMIESVLISEDDRNTICLSTQVGCNIGCEFCATGKMGFRKNLDISQIILQIYCIKKISKKNPTNIVFMGMGEPFLNYDNLLNALKILTDKDGLGISSKKITVSTVGIKNKIKKFADDLVKAENKTIKNTKLALSLHTTDQGIREKIIPIARANKLSELYQELIYFYRKTKTKITYEYIYFNGLNDTENDMKRLEKLSGMLPCNFNIIPFHPIKSVLKPPLNVFEINNTEFKGIDNSLFIKSINYFIAQLRNKKVVVNLRSSSGVDINAACGQLATQYQNQIF
ncbi:MAG TPA: 23S rRNA (adenine(2503)-C(2))-methyltransferase RlmN [Ignavibacteria bacterium]